MTGDPEMSCGDRLRMVRRKLGLTQREIAAELGVSRELIGSVECGCGDLSRALLQKLIARFGISADWLLTGQGRAFIHQQTETQP